MDLKPREEREQIVQDFVRSNEAGNPGTCFGCCSCWYVDVDGEVQVSCHYKSKTQGASWYDQDKGCDKWYPSDKLLKRVFPLTGVKADV